MENKLKKVAGEVLEKIQVAMLTNTSRSVSTF